MSVSCTSQLTFMATAEERASIGRFIGTACLCVMKDPQTGWVNFGAYRIQSDTADWVTLRMSPGRHGVTIRDKYWKEGKPCPVAIVCGQDPLLYMVSGLRFPSA